MHDLIDLAPRNAQGRAYTQDVAVDPKNEAVLAELLVQALGNALLFAEYGLGL